MLSALETAEGGEQEQDAVEAVERRVEVVRLAELAVERG